MADDMARAGLPAPTTLRVDGGMVRNEWFLQNLSDCLNLPVERPALAETTALGAAYLAGIQAGVFGGLNDVSRAWRCNARFEPNLDERVRSEGYERWRGAVARVLT